MANEEITISELELADEVLADMVLAVDTTTDTRAVTLRQLKAWLGSSLPTGFILPAVGKISDERFTLLDGKTLARTGTYEAFCNKVIEQVQAGNWQSCTEAQYNQDLADFGQCWKFVITSDYVRIPTFGHELYSEVLSGQLSCKGNGMTLGLTDGTLNRGFAWSTTLADTAKVDAYGVSVGTSVSGSGFTADKALGITTDKTKSGIVADVENIKGNVKVYYYMVVSTEGQQEEIEVDINEVYEDLNLKANADLSNVPNSKGILVESYRNGDSWYRIYSDGWCEQGGTITTHGSSTQFNQTFLKNFANIPNVQITLETTYMQSYYAAHMGVNSVTVSGFNYYSGMIGLSKTFWQACGYIS